jgi:uncharacterized protein (TIGR00251 family)
MTVELPIREHPDGVVIDVWVVPGAGRDEIAGLHGGALRVRVSAPPEGGKANRSVARLVARAVGARRGTLVGSPKSRRKQILVAGVTVADAADRLREWAERP